VDVAQGFAPCKWTLPGRSGQANRYMLILEPRPVAAMPQIGQHGGCSGCGGGRIMATGFCFSTTMQVDPR